MGHVSCISKGRYGNFCFANMTAYAYSLKHDMPFHIQDKSIAPHLWPLYHQDLRHDEWNPELETVYVNDNQHNYRELEFKEEWRGKNIIIGTTDINTGYFQSYLYLKGYEEEIKKKFFSNIYEKINNRQVFFWIDNNSASLHIRRGDYLSLHDLHPTVTMGYILRAISKCICMGVKNFVVYSDDIEWCKSNVPIEANKFSDCYFSFREGFDEVTDFFSMMHHPVNVIGNSSYSMLASILNTSFRKIVISPDEESWYGLKNKHLSVETMIPKEYIRIKY